MKFLEAETHQPRARAVFDELSARIRVALPNARIEHIGSSAIDGALSKLDLDVFVGVDPSEFEAAIPILESLGLHVKESTLRTDVLCPFESKAFGLDVGVQLVANGSRFEFFLTFRDRTNENAALRNAYNELKRSASPLSMAEYREVKSAFVEAVLAGSSLPSPRSLRGGVDGAW